MRWMWLGIAGVVVGGLVSGIIVGRNVRGQRQPLTVDTPFWVEHDVAPNSAVSHNFVIANSARVPVRVTSIRRTCDCAKAELSANPIPARSAVVLRCTLVAPTRGSRAGTAVMLMTDHPKQALLVLRLTAELAPTLALSPDRLFWDCSNQYIRQTKTVSVCRLDNASLETVRVVSAPANVSWQVVRRTRSVSDVMLELIGPPTASRSEITLQTNVPKCEEAKIPIYFANWGDVRLIPEYMLLPRACGNNTVWIQALRSEPFTGVHIVRCPQYLEVQATLAPDHVLVSGRVSARVPAGVVEDEIKIAIATDKASIPVSVPVKVCE